MNDDAGVCPTCTETVRECDCADTLIDLCEDDPRDLEYDPTPDDYYDRPEGA